VAERRDTAPSVAPCVGEWREACACARQRERDGRNLRRGIGREPVVHVHTWLGRRGQVDGAQGSGPNEDEGSGNNDDKGYGDDDQD
jgi:hypothetical protein